MDAVSSGKGEPMSESNRYGYGKFEVAQPAEEPTSGSNVKNSLKKMSAPFVKFGKAVDHAIPNIRTVDGMAYALAKRTPRTLAICMVLLLAGIVASRLNIWTEGYLWGIPSLGAISMGIGFWVWSSNVMMRPDLSPDARATLQRAIRLQLLMVGAGALAAVYFVGMAVGFW